VIHLKAQMFIYIYICRLQWAKWLAYHQKHYEIPPPQVEITFFTLFYIVMQNHIGAFVLHLHYFTWLCKII
jgi:hypothetical protein